MRRSHRFSAAALLVAILAPGCDFDDAVSMPPFGTLVIETATTGSNPDANGYEISVSGATINVTRSIELNARTAFSVLRGGECRVELRDVAPNCAVDLNPQTARVPERGSETVRFNVACV